MSSTNYRVLPMCLSQLDEVVDVHMSVFPNFYLTKLGRDCLKQYYRSIVLYKRSICLVVVARDSRVTGFCVGANLPSKFSRFLLSRWIFFAFPVFRAFATNPGLIISTAQAVGRLFADSKRKAAKVEKQWDDDICELTSIGVLPGQRQVGALLLDEFIRGAMKQMCTSIRLKTDKNNNEKVVQFYKKNGFTVEGSVRRTGGREMLIFARDLGRAD